MYHFQLNGIDVTCETAEELYAFASFKSWTPSDGSEPLHAAIDEHHEQNGNGRHRPDLSALWAKARRKAKRDGIGVRDAMRELQKK